MTELDQRIRQILSNQRDVPQSLRRRRLLKATLVAATLPWLTPLARATETEFLFTDYPFKLGVASGTPSANSVVLWTRLCPDPLHGGGMGRQQVPIRWEVADDDKFANVVKRGTWWAMAGLGHSVHVSVDGLQPAREYFYRFIAGDEVSAVGRTRTLPAIDANANRLRFALASCQNYELGYFSPYKHMLADNPDLVFFVGDYIYEDNQLSGRIRLHCNDEPYTLEDYRTRYSQYHLDPDLKAMHQAVPWAFTIDDHEVMNDWAGDVGEDLDPNFVQRRANALQAYFENIPLPMDTLMKNHRLALYRTLQAGNLARFHILDDRQYRSPEACSKPGMGGSTDTTIAACPELADRRRTMLGARQQAWLDQQLRQSKAHWNFIVQETLVSTMSLPSKHGRVYYTDPWDGYPAARQRLLDGIRRSRARNPVILGGDLHCTFAANLKADFNAPDSPVIGSEFVGTSITSHGISMDIIRAEQAANPHLIYGESRYRGYLRFDLKPEGLDVAVRDMETVTTPEAPCLTRKRFHVSNGKPGVIELT